VLPSIVDPAQHCKITDTDTPMSPSIHPSINQSKDLQPENPREQHTTKPRHRSFGCVTGVARVSLSLSPSCRTQHHVVGRCCNCGCLGLALSLWMGDRSDRLRWRVGLLGLLDLGHAHSSKDSARNLDRSVGGPIRRIHLISVDR